MAGDGRAQQGNGQRRARCLAQAHAEIEKRGAVEALQQATMARFGRAMGDQAMIEGLGPGSLQYGGSSGAHGGSIRAALAHALGIEPEKALGFAIDNCSLTRLDHFADENARRVGAVNRLLQLPGRLG